MRRMSNQIGIINSEDCRKIDECSRRRGLSASKDLLSHPNQVRAKLSRSDPHPRKSLYEFYPEAYGFKKPNLPV